MQDLDRRQFVAAAALAAAGAAAPTLAAPGNGDDMTWSPAWKLREMMAARRVSASEVTEHFLARIAALDPKLNAFRTLDAAGARQQAKAADAALARGDAPGALHGIPIAIKEGVTVKGLADRGSAGRPAEFDDIMVERLRSAGAVIVGSTVMPGMGGWAEQKTAYGVEAPSLARHPRNPWRTDRVPGSSSAGSGAVAAAALTPIAIGGDGGGSTRLPAALCGVVGVHTALGRIPSVDYQNGHFQLTNSHGPMCRDIRDAATVMQVVSGPDGRDFISIQDQMDFLGDLDRGVSGMKFAWTENYGFGASMGLWKSQPVVDAIRAAAERFTGLGAQVAPTPEVWPDFYPAYITTGRFYVAGTPSRTGNQQIAAPNVVDALEVRRRVYATFMRVFEKNDLLLSPTLNFTAPTVEAWDQAWSGDASKYPHGMFAPVYTSTTHIYNWMGWPAVSIPVGFVDGLPVGLQISAPPWREALIYRAAAAMLKAHPVADRPNLA